MEDEEKDRERGRVDVGKERRESGDGGEKIWKGKWTGNKSEKQYKKITRKGDVSYEQYIVEKNSKAPLKRLDNNKNLRFEAGDLTRDVLHKSYYSINSMRT